MSRWPADNQRALIAFYGDPGKDEVARQLVRYKPPFQMYFGKTKVGSLLLHAKCSAAFARAFDKIWNYYGRDQDVIDSLRISQTAGTYVKRMIRGSTTRWSNHAFGGALDLDAEHNGFNAKNTIPGPVIAAFKSEGMRWGGDYQGRKDPMHFECCQGRDPDRTFSQWLAFYKCPDQYEAPVGIVDSTADVPANGIVTDDDHYTPEVTSQGNEETVDDRVDEMHYTDVATTTTKSLFKSKLNAVLQGLGLAGSGAVVSTDSNMQSAFMQLVSNPKFLWVVIIVVLVGAGMFFYWRDHGKGSVR
jgi:hypothetical protein